MLMSCCDRGFRGLNECMWNRNGVANVKMVIDSRKNRVVPFKVKTSSRVLVHGTGLY